MRSVPSNHLPSNHLILLFLAFVVTFWDYQFGLYDHQEHLPLLFRTQDPNYLPNDFFINANEKGFDPRYYFSWLIIVFTQLFSLPFTYLLLTFLANLGIAWASFSAGKQFFSPRAGLWAAVLVLSVPTVHLGSVCDVSASYLTPNILAFSLVLCALVMVWQARWLWVGCLLGLASLLHPLVGPECGLLFFGIGFLQLFAEHRFRFAAYRSFFLGSLVWIGIAGFQLLPYFFGKADSGELSDADFIRIYAQFRNPHHILPSQFLSPEEWKKAIYLLFLLLGTGLGWRRVDPQQGKLQIQVLLLLSAFLGLAFLGWFLVEIYPMRLLVTAQTFRLLYVVKWLALVLLGGYAAWLSEQPDTRHRLYAWALLAASFAWAGAVRLLFLLFLSNFLHRRYAFPRSLKWLETALLLVLTLYHLYHAYLSLEWGAEVYLWLLFLLLVLLPQVLRLPNLLLYFLYLALATAQLTFWLQYQRSDDMPPLQRALARRYSLDDFQGDIADAAAQIRLHTPPDAILLTPPMHSELRYLAHRALLVDFKTYPFAGRAMLEWQERLFDVYGWTDKNGFDAVSHVLVVNYEYTQDEKILYLKKRYHCDYALLWKKIPTQFPVLYENKTYRLVRIEG